MALLKKMISSATLKSRRKKWVFKDGFFMFWLKFKQEKQAKIRVVKIFMVCYALSVNFMLFNDFDLKSEIVMFFP